MRTFAITGGAGFIGSHLADALLAQGDSVRILDDFSTGKLANLDPRCEVLRGDVRDREAVNRLLSGVAGCFHLAAIASVARSTEDWRGTHEVNLGGTVTVLEAAVRATRVPVVYASSAAVYGALDGVAEESALTEPLTAYGADKRGGELHARAGGIVHGLPTLGLRFFNVYGPRQDPASPYSGVISIFMQLSSLGQPLQVNGTGRQSRDFIFVGDIVAFLLAGMAALREGRPGFTPDLAPVLNACTGRETSILALAEAVAAVYGGKPALRFSAARHGDIGRSVGNPDRALHMLGIVAGTSLAEGLRQTAAGLCGQTSLQAA